MRGSLGCAVAGVVLLAILYGLFFIVMMIEPGFAIMIMVVGMVVVAGTVVAFIAGIYEVLSNKRKGE